MIRARLTYPEDSTNSLGDVLTWISGFTSSNSDHLDTSVGEGGVDESGKETSEATSVAGTDVFLHRTLLPIPKPATIMVWRTAEHDDKRGNEQTQNGNYLDTSEDELSFSIDTYGEDIQGDDDDDNDSNPNGRVDFLLSIPEREEDGSSRYFSTESDGTLIPVVPSNRLELLANAT